jgi:hypothetical protein
MWYCPLPCWVSAAVVLQLGNVVAKLGFLENSRGWRVGAESVVLCWALATTHRTEVDGAEDDRGVVVVVIGSPTRL